MRDWTGSQIRQDALTVPCRYCNAQPGDPCTVPGGKTLDAFPAHLPRIKAFDSKGTTDAA